VKSPAHIIALFFVASTPLWGQDADEMAAFDDSLWTALETRINSLEVAEVHASPLNPSRPKMKPSEVLQTAAIDQIPATSRIEALQALPGVDMVSNGAGTLRPVIRGLSGLRIATLFNGARIESQAWGEYHGIYLPEEGVQAVEVIRGPATLAYGSDAYGGVINFIPKAPLSEQGRENRISLSGFSATQGWQVSGATEKRSKTTFHSFRGGFKRHGDYALPNGSKVDNSAYQQFFGQGSFGYIRPWGVIEGAYSSAYNTAGLIGYDGYQQTGDHLVTTSMRFGLGDWQITPRVSYQLNHRKEFDRSRDQQPGEGALELLALDISLRTLRWETIAHRERPNGWSTTLGLQGFEADSRFDDDGTVELVFTPLIPNASANESSAFAVFDRDLGRSGFQVSGRSDRRVTQAASSRTDWLNSMAAGAHWDLSKSTRLWTHVARNERAPGMAELYSQGIHYCAFRFEQGNAGLSKERSFNVESSLEWNPVWGRFEFALYQNTIANYVYIRPSGLELDGWQVYAWEATDAQFNGGEASVQVQPAHWKHLHADAVFSLVDARDRNGNALPLIPPATFRSTLGWAGGSKGRLHDMFANVVWNHNRDASLLHLAAGGALSDALELNLSVQNLLNAEFIPTMSMLRELNIAEPGRNVRMQLVLKF
jgi:iron complex outermembrane recepter protein